MKVYYREGNDAFYGDLMYITDGETPFVSFDTKGRDGQPRKMVSLHLPTIKSIGMSRIHVLHKGVDYLFYTEKPEWIVERTSVAAWARTDYDPPPEEDVGVIDMLFSGKTS